MSSRCSQPVDLDPREQRAPAAGSRSAATDAAAARAPARTGSTTGNRRSPPASSDRGRTTAATTLLERRQVCRVRRTRSRRWCVPKRSSERQPSARRARASSDPSSSSRRRPTVTWRPPANCATIACDRCGVRALSARRRRAGGQPLRAAPGRFSLRVPSVRGSSPDGHTEIAANLLMVEQSRGWPCRTMRLRIDARIEHDARRARAPRIPSAAPTTATSLHARRRPANARSTSSGKDVQPFGRHDHLLLAALDEQPALRVDFADVAGVEPAAFERFGRSPRRA